MPIHGIGMKPVGRSVWLSLDKRFLEFIERPCDFGINGLEHLKQLADTRPFGIIREAAAFADSDCLLPASHKTVVHPKLNIGLSHSNLCPL